MKSSNQNLKNSKSKSTNWSSIIIWIGLALIIRWQIIEPRWIPSGSMLPTLQIKDKILIEKVSPRYLNRNHKHIGHESIVVFSPPAVLIESGYDKNSALIKRVIGVPGDTIEVKNGSIIRNGKEIKESWRKMPIKYEMEQITIPENFLWVLGDNRNNSLDSHLWGPLPEKNVIGTAVLRYWPLDKFGPIRFPTLTNS